MKESELEAKFFLDWVSGGQEDMKSVRFLLFCKAFSLRPLATSAGLVHLELRSPLGLAQARIMEEAFQVTLHGPIWILPGRYHRLSPA